LVRNDSLQGCGREIRQLAKEIDVLQIAQGRKQKGRTRFRRMGKAKGSRWGLKEQMRRKAERWRGVVDECLTLGQGVRGGSSQ
jgi:hypothetical protein